MRKREAYMSKLHNRGKYYVNANLSLYPNEVTLSGEEAERGNEHSDTPGYTNNIEVHLDHTPSQLLEILLRSARGLALL
jgi:hypothetical protein